MEQIYILPDPEVAALLADNGIDLVAELRKQGLDVQGTFKPDPTASGEKDVVLVILAVGASFLAISQGIATILDAIGRNKGRTVVTDKVTPVRNADGDVAWGADGHAVTESNRTVETEPPAPRTDRYEGSVEYNGLKLSFGSSNEPAPA